MGEPNWVNLVGNLSNIGFAVLVGWYLLTRAIPKMQEDFRAEMRLNRDDAAAVIRDNRAENKESLRTVLEHCEKESQRVTAEIATDLGLVQKGLADNVEVLESVRDNLQLVATYIRRMADDQARSQGRPPLPPAAP
jgi:hypothetical protein